MPRRNNTATQFGELDAVANRILLSLPPATFERIHPAGRINRFNLFTSSTAVFSLVKTMRDGRTVEIGAIGVEGVTNPHALFGIDRAVLEAIVQIPGTAFRIDRDTLGMQLNTDGTLRELMQGYARFAASQLAQTAACNRLHSLEERCCRWLLMAHDSALSDTFPLTHEFLAMMLGVSIAASYLQKAGLIDYKRGRMTVTNRSGLEDAACECYDALRIELDRLFGAPKKRKTASLVVVLPTTRRVAVRSSNVRTDAATASRSGLCAPCLAPCACCRYRPP